MFNWLKRRPKTSEPDPSVLPGYYLLSGAAIRALPVLAIDAEQAYELLSSDWWIGLERYPQDVDLLPGELGYDQHSRYIEGRESGHA